MPDKKTIPAPPDEMEVGADARAEKEKQAFQDDSYAEQSRASEHKRSEAVKNIFHYIAVVLFLCFAAAYLAFLIGWAYHMAMPEKSHFLSSAQVDKLQSFILSGVIASALLKYYEKYTK